MHTNANLDTSFDHLFDALPALTWLPWVGAQFAAAHTRTLILGESTYKWRPWTPTEAARIARRDHLRVLHTNHALQVDRPSAYVRNFEKAVFLSKAPGANRKLALWDAVAYHNLVLRPMASVRHRPSYGDYADGWPTVFALCALLKIDQCIVYGLEKKKIDALVAAAHAHGITSTRAILPSVGKHSPVLMTLEGAGISLKLLFIRHPSAYFSWKLWGALMRDAIAPPVPY